MSGVFSNQIAGRIASLHLHPVDPGAPLTAVESFEVEIDKGIVGEPRYFGRTNRTGKPARRQVSLIERELIAGHATALGVRTIHPGAVRSNIETLGIDLVALIGHEVELGEAVLFFYEARTPCAKMDAICAGLRALMENNRQGVLAQVVRPGRIRVNDWIKLASDKT
ncbi:MAG TPA: MOSC domain-containing protein [Verrucomicrobiae bacterium]|nr:MOSC domain-containing protein [Verrucomicrobiae bacterium]